MNINHRVIHLLERIGLTHNEAKFYIVVSKNPKLTIKEAQQKTGLSQASAYRAFERLKNLGLLTSSLDHWKKNIEVVSLKTVAEKLAKEQRKLRKTELELKKLANIMQFTKWSHLEEPIDILTDQNKIIEQCYKILYRPWEKFLCYGSAERLIDIIGDGPEHDFVKIRSKKGKGANVVLSELGNYAKEFIPHNEQDLRNVKVKIDSDHQDYMTYIYDGEVTIWHKDKDLGNRAIVISDPAIVKNYEHMFDILWKKE